MPALLLLCAAQFMVILDITVVNVSLPSIQADLGTAIGDLQWFVTAYSLAFGGLLLLGGRAADTLGRRRIFLAGLGLFTAASLAAALAPSTGTLLAARVGQGIGAALLSPAALSLITVLFPDGPERQRALAAWAAVAASGGAFGVLAGGLLTETLGWRAIFLINVPVGIAVAAEAVRTLPAARPERRGRIDLAGALLATASLLALIYALAEADAAGWGSTQTLGLLGLAAAGLLGFVAVESRVAEPLVSLAVFRRRPTVAALALMVAGMGTIVSAFFFCSLYLQGILGHSALRTGLEFLPGAIVLILAAHGGGHLIGKLGVKPVLAGGMGLGGLGALLLSGVPAEGSYLADVLPGLLVLDVGIGLAAPCIYITAMSGVAAEEAGVVSGLLTTGHEIGVALVLPLLSAIAAAAVGSSSVADALGADPAAVATGFGNAFRAAAAISFGAALLALLALRRDDLEAAGQPAFAHH